MHSTRRVPRPVPEHPDGPHKPILDVLLGPLCLLFRFTNVFECGWHRKEKQGIDRVSNHQCCIVYL